MVLVSYFGATGFLGPTANSGPDTFGLVIGLVSAIALILGVMTAYIFVLARAFYNRSIDYITMEQLSPKADPRDSWWQSMAKALPQPGIELVTNEWYPQRQVLFALKLSIWVARGLHKIGESIRGRRNAMDRDVALEERRA